MRIQKGMKRPPKSLKSLTAPKIKGVVTEFAGATPSATVTFPVVSVPVTYHPKVPYLHIIFAVSRQIQELRRCIIMSD